MESPVIVPITLWNSSLPTFRASCISVTPNFRTVITGSCTGQLCFWDFNLTKEEVTPRSLVIGHEHGVTCVVSRNEYAISSSEGGELCRWNLEDGYCDKANTSSVHTHRAMQLVDTPASNEELLFTCGDYSNIYIYHPVTLQKITHLDSQTDCNWIANFHVVPSYKTDGNLVAAGITSEGCIKFWEIEDHKSKSLQEVQSNNLPVDQAVDLKYNSDRTVILVVTIECWYLFDSELLNSQYKIQSVHKEKLLGGNFFKSHVIVWTESGKFFYYREVNSEQVLVTTLLDESFKFSLFKPAMLVAGDGDDSRYFLRGDSLAQLTVWSCPDELTESTLRPSFSGVINQKWLSLKNCFFFDTVVSYSTVTCSIYILELDKFFLGCQTGKIISTPAMQTMMSFYFWSSNEKPCCDFLSGHTGRINCLLYPHSKYSHYDKSHLVSGGNDFSVCLWDIFKLELLHRFCVQAGEILKLMVPPSECSAHVRQSVCSVSSDHSVALLNLTDRRCVILTSRHLFPVVTVNWKPLDGFLIVECFDGTVYVWETETGHLDRVLDGVVAQEVVYACGDERGPARETGSLVNFYIRERVVGKNSMKRDVFQVTGSDVESAEVPIKLNGFLMNEVTESHVFVCNVESLIRNIVCDRRVHAGPDEDGPGSGGLYMLTQVSPAVDVGQKRGIKSTKSKSDGDLRPDVQAIANGNVRRSVDADADLEECYFPLFSKRMFKILRFLLSSLHIWDVDPSVDDLLVNRLGLLKPDVAPAFGILSPSGAYSLCLDGVRRPTSTTVASTCLIMTALSTVLKSISQFSFRYSGGDWITDNGSGGNDNDEDEEDSKEQLKVIWETLHSFYERICSRSGYDGANIPKPRIEILAKAWQSKCGPLRNAARKLLPGHLESLLQPDHADLLKFWYSYLPHFRISGRTSESDTVDLKSIALVLFGTAGSDLKFKANFPSTQENYVYQTCASLVYLLLLPNPDDRILGRLQTLAIDFIGRGFIVWEQFLKIEKVFPVLFHACRNLLRFTGDPSGGLQGPTDRCLTAHESLKAIAVARTSAFIKCLIDEINQVRSSQASVRDGFSIENSKPEILSIIVFLLEKTPYIMLLYLNEVISICVYCIDVSHLKQESLDNLLPIMRKFRQVHHSVPGQKIAVGLGTGSIVVHDLKTRKAVPVTAHKDSVSVVRFSDDGKCLASYSCYENRLAFWQVLTGIFGLGHIQVKCTKTYETYQIRDEEIRNHLEIGRLTWTDSKSVTLNLCDGTESVFHS